MGLLWKTRSISQMGTSMIFQHFLKFFINDNYIYHLKKKKNKGKTGYPWIDACMRQLLQEGWIHHVCRNSTAIFLTRGVLFLSWERGMNTFFKYQIDVLYRFNSFFLLSHSNLFKIIIFFDFARLIGPYAQEIGIGSVAVIPKKFSILP